MNKYKILTKSSNGNYSHFKTVTLKDNQKANEVVENLEKNTGFDYKWEFIEEVEDGEVVIDSEESSDEEEEVVEESVEEESDEEEELEQLDDSLFVEEADDDEYPRGWHLRKEFVDREGTVYHRGDEQPDLYRTQEPSEY